MPLPDPAIDLVDLVGPMEIAEMTGLKLESVHQYRSRGKMPEPVAVISRTSLWWKEDILEWDRTRLTRPEARHG